MKQIFKHTIFIILLTVTNGIYAQTEINTEVLKKPIEPSDIVVIQYYDSDCSACMAAKPMYEELADNYSGKVSFLQIDIAQSNVEYGVKVTPTYQIIAGAGNLETLEGNPGMYYLDYIIGATVNKRNESGLSTGNATTTLSDLIGLNGETTSSSKKLLLKINGGFEDPGPPDAFQIFDFCQQLRDDGVVFGSEAEKIFIKYMSKKLLGINSGYEGKIINDQPYAGYIKKYLNKLQCDTKEITSLSMREKNSFFKHMIDIGRADYIAEYYLTRCSNHLENPNKLNANQYEIINGEKETILDFVIKSIDFRNNRSINITENQDQLIRIKESLIRYCGAKRGAKL